MLQNLFKIQNLCYIKAKHSNSDTWRCSLCATSEELTAQEGTIEG